MDTTPETPKRADYSKILDTPLAPVARKIAVGMTMAKNMKELQEDTGGNRQYIHAASDKAPVRAATVAATLAKQEKLDELLKMLKGIIDMPAETPLKHSDKIAATKLYAELSGITTTKQGDTYNVGIFDLRNATEEELVKELARIEESKRSVIDVTPIDTDSSEAV